MIEAAIEAPRPAAADVLGALYRFMLEPASPRSLGVFRIGIASIQIALAITLLPYVLQLYGALGLVQWRLGELVVLPGVPSIGGVANLLGTIATPAQCVYGIYIVYLFSLGCLLIGWRSHWAGATAWLTHLAITDSGYFTTYGVDRFSQICLFYCAWMPTGNSLSLDSHRGRVSNRPSWLAGLSIRTLQIHLCVVYLTSGASKILGEQWWNGEAIWRAVMEPQFAQFDLSWLASFPWIATATGWIAMLVEAGYSFFVWPQATRKGWIAATIALHLAIGLFLGLWFFSAIMIVMNVSAFGISDSSRALHAGSRAAGSLPPSLAATGRA